MARLNEIHQLVCTIIDTFLETYESELKEFESLVFNFNAHKYKIDNYTMACTYINSQGRLGVIINLKHPNIYYAWNSQLHDVITCVLRHEIRHLFQLKYIMSLGLTLDEAWEKQLELQFTDYENDPYELDAHDFEKNINKKFNEDLDWIKDLI